MSARIIKKDSYFLKDINFVIRTLIISDTILSGALALLAPVFALFIDKYIAGANEAVVGVAAAIYLFSKSIFQIPVAAVIDKIKGEKDDFYILFIFTLIIAVLPLLYLMISTTWQLYLVQLLLGVFTAFTFPSYMAIFTRHIDKSKEAGEWGVYFTLTDLSSAALAAIGGYVAYSLGFSSVIISVVVLSIIGSLLLWQLKPYIRMPKK